MKPLLAGLLLLSLSTGPMAAERAPSNFMQDHSHPAREQSHFSRDRSHFSHERPHFRQEQGFGTGSYSGHHGWQNGQYRGWQEDRHREFQRRRPMDPDERLRRDYESLYEAQRRQFDRLRQQTIHGTGPHTRRPPPHYQHDSIGPGYAFPPGGYPLPPHGYPLSPRRHSFPPQRHSLPPQRHSLPPQHHAPPDQAQRHPPATPYSR